MKPTKGDEKLHIADKLALAGIPLFLLVAAVMGGFKIDDHGYGLWILIGALAAPAVAYGGWRLLKVKRSS